MGDGAFAGEFARRLEELKVQQGGVVSLDRVTQLIDSLLRETPPDGRAADIHLYLELKGLAQFLVDLRRDVARIRPEEVKDEYLPSVADELDAIVDATEKATHAIMDATEKVEDVARDLGGAGADTLAEATTAIYEACTFQDITGQRISKVIKALHYVEERIDGLLAVLGRDLRKGAAVGNPPTKAEGGESHLLEGPQLAGKAKGQDEIDALFTSLDG